MHTIDTIRRFLPSLVVMVLGSLAGFVNAQSYPAKPLTMVVPSAVGSGNDITARRFGIAFQEELKQSIVVENRPVAVDSIRYVTCDADRFRPEGLRCPDGVAMHLGRAADGSRALRL